MTRTLLLCLCLAAGAAQAQTYKCVDARGKVTYTSTPCEDAGLKGGEIRDRMNTAPAQKVPPPEAPAPTQASKGPGTMAGEKPAGGSGVKPERRCFTTKTGTRCNDDPGEPDPVPADARSRGETKANN